MKILVLGSKGQLGNCLYDQFSSSTFRVIYSSRSELDLTNIHELHKYLIKTKPSLVINAAAYTQVDKAENDIKSADLLNHLMVKELAKICNEYNIWLIHLSTDYVFNGNSDKPYLEDDKIDPKCVYGVTKSLGELAITENLKKYIVIRTSWVFSEHGYNFLKTMLRLAENNKELSIVDDQVGCPTYAQDIAKVILHITNTINLNNNSFAGIYHYSGNKSCTWYSFAKFIFKKATSMGYTVPARIIPINTSDYPTPAKRPIYSILNCHKIQKIFNIKLSDWEKGVSSTLNNIRNII